MDYFALARFFFAAGLAGTATGISASCVFRRASSFTFSARAFSGIARRPPQKHMALRDGFCFQKVFIEMGHLQRRLFMPRAVLPPGVQALALTALHAAQLLTQWWGHLDR